MSSPGPLRNTDVDRLVLEYLRKRNFKEAEKVLQLEMKEAVPEQEVLVHSWLGQGQGEAVVERLLFATAGGGDPAELAAGFERLATWVDGSLDLYKARPELSRVLFPTFAHVYLALIELGASGEAQQLMAAQRPRFLDAAAGGSSLRAQELRDLASIASPEGVATSRTAAALRSRRIAIRLCRPSYDLLAQHLQQPRQMVVLGIVNEHLKFEVHDGRPATLAELAGVEEDLSAGAMQADVVATNQRPLDLQLLEGGVEDRWAAQQAERAEEEANRRAQEAAGTKKERIALQRAAAEAKSKRENIGLDRMAPAFPLPPVGDEQEAALMGELQLRQHVSASALPSCCFFTFFNTHQSLNCVAFTSDAEMVAGGFADSSVRLYNLHTRASAAREAAAAAAAGGPPGPRPDWITYFTGHSGAVYGLDFSPDNQLLFSASGDGTVRLWSMEVRANLAVYKGHMLPVWDVAACPYFSPFYFASCGADRTARLWSTDRAQPLRLFVGHTSDVDVVRWHPNCHYLATGSADRTVRLWDVRSGECCRLLVGHKDKLSSLAFSPDGASLATADASGALSVWDLGSARRIASFRQHRGPVWSLAYSQGEGALLASGGADHTVRIWNAKPGAARGPPGGDAAAPGAAAAQQPPPTKQQQQGGEGAAKDGKGGQGEPYEQLCSWRTKLTPVYGLRFTTRNLLLGSGALTIPGRK